MSAVDDVASMTTFCPAVPENEYRAAYAPGRNWLLHEDERLPETVAPIVVGVTVHAAEYPAWLMVNGCPAMVNFPVRDDGAVFASTV